MNWSVWHCVFFALSGWTWRNHPSRWVSCPTGESCLKEDLVRLLCVCLFLFFCPHWVWLSWLQISASFRLLLCGDALLTFMFVNTAALFLWLVRRPQGHLDQIWITTTLFQTADLTYAKITETLKRPRWTTEDYFYTQRRTTPILQQH